MEWRQGSKQKARLCMKWLDDQAGVDYSKNGKHCSLMDAFSILLLREQGSRSRNTEIKKEETAFFFMSC